MANTLIKNLKSKASDVKLYWNIPMPGRYMPFKEIAAYAGGGIGAYFIIVMGSNLIVNAQNMIVGGAIGISPTHMYLLYLIATFVNIPLTALRASMIDNARNKAGKYRPYILSMGIPTVAIVLSYVWFPYDKLYDIFSMQLFGYEGGYVAKCAVVLIFNLLLQFFFNFFNDAYTNLIHVLSPNTQERTDVLAIKSVVYSLAPSIVNAVIPAVAKYVANDNLYDIRVYRVSYPVFAIFGLILIVFVFGFTKEKIVQAKTRVAQVRFVDAFKSVAKNKYFWIIALAGWLGFLESAYGNILAWSYNYGHTTDGGTYSLITLLVGNASLWGMLLAPFCIRAFGKKKVLIGVNLMNVACIFSMGLRKESILWITVCVYINYLFGAFEQITTPAIQADIRDYHQYKTGERVDGMFATVTTIGNVVTLITSMILPLVYEKYGIYEGNGYSDSPYDILDVTTGEPGLLYKVMGALIVMAGIGAFLNVVPYFFYDLKETQQKGIVRVLKVRAMFEDYGNGVTNNRTLVEAIDIIREARELAKKETVTSFSSSRKEKKAQKKLNEEIQIAKFVCEELEKFENGIYKIKHDVCYNIYKAGLTGLYNMNKEDILAEIQTAKAMPKNTAEEKELRKFSLEMARNKLSARKAIDKYYKTSESFIRPKYDVLDELFNREDEIEALQKQLYIDREEAKKAKDSFRLKEISDKIKALKTEKKDVEKAVKAEMDKQAYFMRAAKLYVEAERIVNERENYQHFDELAAKYDEAKAKEEADMKAAFEEQKRLEAEKAEKTRQLKEEKAAAKLNKKNK